MFRFVNLFDCEFICPSASSKGVKVSRDLGLDPLSDLC